MENIIMNRYIYIILVILFASVNYVQAQFFLIDEFWSEPEGKRARVSSSDKNGGNIDYIYIESYRDSTIFNFKGSGLIQRIWFTLDIDDTLYLQKTKISMIFDNEKTVTNIPVGMFSGTGPWKFNDLTTHLINTARSRRFNKDQPGVGYGSFNFHWPMPFTTNAKITIHNTSKQRLRIFYYVDYLIKEHLNDPLLFRADYNITSPTVPSRQLKINSVDSNFVLLDKQGYKGKYVGTILCVESHPDRIGKWYEGDDMFVIDNEPWPPRLEGTGTEDYFGLAWGFHREYQAFDHGITHYERNLTDRDRMYDGRFVVYRFHINDPIIFYTDIHASIEAGHANECAQHYESVAIWYGKKTKDSN